MSTQPGRESATGLRLPTADQVVSALGDRKRRTFSQGQVGRGSLGRCVGNGQSLGVVGVVEFVGYEVCP